MKSYGFDVVTFDELDVYLREHGIRNWQQRGPVENMCDFLKCGDGHELALAQRYAAEQQAMRLTNPRDNSEFIGFRTLAKDSAQVFVLMSGSLVLVVAEYKHGTEEIIVTLPCGVPEESDGDGAQKFANCMVREVLEETGLTLYYAEALTDHGLGVSPRKSTERYWPVLGFHPARPVARQQPKCDQTEVLRPFLMPLRDFALLVHSGKTHDATVGTTLILALRRLFVTGNISEEQLMVLFNP